VAVAHRGGVKIFTGTQLARFQRESEGLTDYISDKFSIPALERDPLLVL